VLIRGRCAIDHGVVARFDGQCAVAGERQAVGALVAKMNRRGSPCDRLEGILGRYTR
jgi:hypothetical protein